HPRSLHSFPTRRSSDLSDASRESDAARESGAVPRADAGSKQGRGRAGRTAPPPPSPQPPPPPASPPPRPAAPSLPPSIPQQLPPDRKSTRLNSSHVKIS